jgi:flagellar export protein FliJ
VVPPRWPNWSVREGGVSGFANLLRLARHRAEAALVAWQRADGQCADAKAKLAALERHAEAYRNRLKARLQQGVPAAVVAAELGFIGQIATVAARQRVELGQLEAASAHHWQELVSVRRVQRMYQLLSERAAARATETARLRQQRAADEAMQRAQSRSPAALRQRQKGA